MDEFGSSVWSGVLAGVIATLITGVPSAIIAFLVTRKLEQRYGGSGNTTTPQPAPPHNYNDFQRIEVLIENHISSGASKTSAKKDPSFEAAGLLTVALTLVAALASQYPVIIIGALTGLSAGIALALLATLTRNWKFRRFLGHNGVLGLANALFGVLAPIMAIVALVNVRYKRLSFWDLGQEIRKNSGVGEEFANPLDWALQHLGGLITGVVKLLQTHGIEFLSVLLFPLAAVAAAVLAGALAATTLVGWNFYIGFIVGSNTLIARRAVRAFTRLTLSRVASMVLVLTVLMAVAFWGGSWVNFTNGQLIPTMTGSPSPTP